MANHSYVKFEDPITPTEAKVLLTLVTQRFWGDRVRVEDVEGSDRTWVVRFPGTAPDLVRARTLMMSPDEDYGFVLWLDQNGRMLEFRHPFNNWEWWAQHKVEHQMAQELSQTQTVTITDDGSGDVKINAQKSRDTYRQYITRNFKEPYSEADQSWFNTLLATAPEGFRD